MTAMPNGDAAEIPSVDVHNSNSYVKAKLTCTMDCSKAKRNALHYLAMFFWGGWTFYYFAFMFIWPFVLYYAQGVFTCIVALGIISAFAPIDMKKQPRVLMKLGLWTMKKACEYMHMRTYVEDAELLNNHKQYMFGMEPHDVLPLSIAGFHYRLFNIGGIRPQGAITGLCFKVPFMRHVYTWMTAASVDKKDIIKSINSGNSPVICPGGVQEVIYLAQYYHQEPSTQASTTGVACTKTCTIYLKRRAGFIKLALKHGLPLVPVFSFGLRDLFDFYIPNIPWLHKLGRKWGALPMMFFGLWGLPLGPGKPSNITNVVGRPIIVPKIEQPTDDDIQKYHTMFIDEMFRIFYTYREDYGMGDTRLKIV